MKHFIYLTLFLGLSLSSCSIEKRMHRSGYHLDWHHSSNDLAVREALPATAIERRTSEQAWQALAGLWPQSQPLKGIESFQPEPEPETAVFPLKAESAEPQAKKATTQAAHQIKKAVAFLNPLERTRSGLNRIADAVTSEPSAHGLSIASFVVSLVGLFVFSVILGPIAIIFSAIGLSKANRYPEQWKGKGLAITGLILGILETLLGLILIAAVV